MKILLVKRRQNISVRHLVGFIMFFPALYLQRRIQNPIKHLRWNVLRKQRLLAVNYFRRMLHLRCSIEFWIRLEYTFWICAEAIIFGNVYQFLWLKLSKAAPKLINLVTRFNKVKIVLKVVIKVLLFSSFWHMNYASGRRY